MSQSTSRSHPAFTPDSGKPPSKARALLSYEVTAKDAMTVGVALLSVIGALGWTFSSPAKRIDYLAAATTARFDTTNREVASLGKRTDRLEEAQRFTNYMLCMSARRNDPASVPPDCAPIIESRSARRVP